MLSLFLCRRYQKGNNSCLADVYLFINFSNSIRKLLFHFQSFNQILKWSMSLCQIYLGIQLKKPVAMVAWRKLGVLMVPRIFVIWCNTKIRGNQQSVRLRNVLKLLHIARFSRISFSQLYMFYFIRLNETISYLKALFVFA